MLFNVEQVCKEGPTPKSGWKLDWEYGDLTADVNQLHGNNLPTPRSSPTAAQPFLGSVVMC